jgi:hypothetical protein
MPGTELTLHASMHGNTLWEHHNPPSNGGLDQWLTSSIMRIADVALLVAPITQHLV